jgi:broad specificity phosphatase PhoE
MTDQPVKADAQVASAFTVATPLADDVHLWLVRHGQTEWSASGQHTGRTDIPLTDEGRRQAESLQPVFAALRPSLVLCSPRQRARQTAELAGLVVDDVDPDLAEWDYGDYEGLTSAQIRERDPQWSIWTRPCPGGETAAEVSARADRVITKAAPYLESGPVVLVSHGHMSRVIGARWVGLDATGGRLLALSTGSTSVLGGEHGLPVVSHWNVEHAAPTREVQATARGANA